MPVCSRSLSGWLTSLVLATLQISVLENHHAATTYGLLQDPKFNVLANVSFSSSFIRVLVAMLRVRPSVRSFCMCTHPNACVRSQLTPKDNAIIRKRIVKASFRCCSSHLDLSLNHVCVLFLPGHSGDGHDHAL